MVGLSDGYVKYEKAEGHRPVIMQNFRGDKKFFLNGQLAAILDFISVKFVMGYPCVRHYILLYIHGPAISLFFELGKYHKIIKIQNIHLTAILKLFAPKS